MGEHVPGGQEASEEAARKIQVRGDSGPDRDRETGQCCLWRASPLKTVPVCLEREPPPAPPRGGGPNVVIVSVSFNSANLAEHPRAACPEMGANGQVLRDVTLYLPPPLS